MRYNPTWFVSLVLEALQSVATLVSMRTSWRRTTALSVKDKVVDALQGYLPITSGGANLFFQLVNALYEKGAMILTTSNCGFAEWGVIVGDPVVATALLDRLLHHAVAVQIEGASYRLRHNADLILEHTRAHANITPPPPPKRRGRPPKIEGANQYSG